MIPFFQTINKRLTEGDALSLGRWLVIACWITLTGFACKASAEQVVVAAASNFAVPLTAIIAAFQQNAAHEVIAVNSSSGKIYAQIRNGAPFDVFLSADAEKPLKLEKEGYAVMGSRFTYALGRLVLWSADRDRIHDSPEALLDQPFRKLAIANPRLAPYGAAAAEVLTSLGAQEQIKDQLVYGENIAQTYQFVSSGNAELGFVALSQVWREGQLEAGSAWIVPASRHQPIRQDAVLLTRAEDNSAATQFLQFLQSAKAHEILKTFGYDLP